MKRFWTFTLLAFLLISFCAELWIGARPLLVRYQDHFYFPIFSSMRSGEFFGEDYAWEAEYPKLQEKWQNTGSPDWILMPWIPLGPLTIDLVQSPPAAPDVRHWFGTDSSGRDVLARFIYGFRTAFVMAVAYVALTMALALGLALLSALSPGWVDLVLQRGMEIWVMIPFLYVAIAIVSLVTLDKVLLVVILSIFSWPTLSLYLRAQILQVKEQDYIQAARVLGLPQLRIICFHILPQIWPFLLSFLPFVLAAALVTLTSLDFLGFGLPPPEPSWGDLLQQALERPYAWWIAAPVLVGLFVVLTAVTVIGEAIRNKQNPRQTQNQ
ncbi:ABC transporter permease subunit [Oligoflexus tunisiensis]|uniref:ABC transporter permease subunit n=1 Tax=Oligoflexus tunisiensis TaxID=708132 RepID=UPI000ACE5A93|nr:ABC transporter permease subunit [Oligoflexus tunisiensis]